jgi:hypothetical protein
MATERLLAAAGTELVPTRVDKPHQLLLDELAEIPQDQFDRLYLEQRERAATKDFYQKLLRRVAVHGELIAILIIEPHQRKPAWNRKALAKPPFYDSRRYLA